jgi:fucose permease
MPAGSAALSAAQVPRDKASGRTRFPLLLSFGYFGVLVGLWGAEIASVKLRSGLSAAALGGVLACLPLGTLVGLRISRVLMNRWSHGLILTWSSVAATAVLIVLVLARNGIVVCVMLLLFGIAMCQMNVAANHYGSMLEAAQKRALMSGLHAPFGYGLAFGAGVVFLSHYVSDDLVVVVAVLTAVLIPVAFSSWRLEPAPAGDEKAGEGPGAAQAAAMRSSMLALGILSMVDAVAESGFSDWVGVYLNLRVGTTTAVAALGFTVFAASITVGRSLGDRVTEKIGSARTLRWGGVMTALGIAVLILAKDPVLAFGGVIVCGLGLSSLGPRIVAAAGKLGGQDTQALTRVIGLSTVGNFAGPPALGAISAGLGLPFAMAVPAICGLIVSIKAKEVDR